MSLPAGERINGIPFPLPPGERVRWEGRPAWRSLARHAFHSRALFAYFTAFGVLRAGLALSDGDPAGMAVADFVFCLLLGLVTSAISLGLAWLSARTTVYAVTDRRVVLKVGMVVSSTINIPFRLVEEAAAKAYGDGTGDIVLRLPSTDRIAYLQLWPHARAWRITRPEPALRSLEDAGDVGRLLGALLAEANGQPVPARRADEAVPPAASESRGVAVPRTTPATAGSLP